jgi:hypothetical protein
LELLYGGNNHQYQIKFFELNPDSPSYWSNLFALADVLFDPANTDNPEQKEKNKANQDKLRQELQRIMDFFKQGNYTPNFFIIQQTLANMAAGDYVKVKGDGRVTKIYREQLQNELEKIKGWLFREVGRLPIRFSSPQMNVTQI